MTKLDRLALLFGAVAAAVFTANALVLGALLPGYDPVSQTISELGEAGAFESMFRVLMLTAMLCVGVFTVGLIRRSLAQGWSPVPGAILAVYPLAAVGAYLFVAPHPLHNIFGIASLIGFLAPLALAVAPSGRAVSARLRAISLSAGLLLLIELGLNLSPLFVNFGEADYVRTHYGAIQRAMYLTFYGWLAYLAIALFFDAKVNRRLPA